MKQITESEFIEKIVIRNVRNTVFALFKNYN